MSIPVFDLGGSAPLRGVNRRLERTLADLGGAKSPELIAAARELVKSIKREVSRRGRGSPSEPGQPPARQSGRLWKSIKQAAVGTGRRVAVTAFYGPFLEFGLDTEGDRSQGQATPRSRRDLFTGLARGVTAKARRAFERKQQRRAAGQGHERRLKPRPFMAQALARAEASMTDVVVSEIQRRTP